MSARFLSAQKPTRDLDPATLNRAAILRQLMKYWFINPGTISYSSRIYARHPTRAIIDDLLVMVGNLLVSSSHSYDSFFQPDWPSRGILVNYIQERISRQFGICTLCTIEEAQQSISQAQNHCRHGRLLSSIQKSEPKNSENIINR